MGHSDKKDVLGSVTCYCPDNIIVGAIWARKTVGPLPFPGSWDGAAVSHQLQSQIDSRMVGQCGQDGNATKWMASGWFGRGINSWWKRGWNNKEEEGNPDVD